MSKPCKDRTWMPNVRAAIYDCKSACDSAGTSFCSCMPPLNECPPSLSTFLPPQMHCRTLPHAVLPTSNHLMRWAHDIKQCHVPVATKQPCRPSYHFVR